MVEPTVFYTTNKPDIKERENVIDFLIAHLREYENLKSDLEKYIDYAMNETTFFGGFNVVYYLENEIRK